MKVRVFRTAREAARAAAGVVAAQLARQPASVLGLPTGRTSLAVYDELARLYQAGDADFAEAHTFNIDEFVGVAAHDKRSYCAFMQKHLFSRVNLPQGHIHFLDGSAPDPQAECQRYEAEIAASGGIDLMLLGIGANAHIAFNEPARVLEQQTHRVRLALETRRANASLFGGRLAKVPRSALTMGVGTLMRSRYIVLVATGRSKARAVASMFSGRIATRQPASLLQLHGAVEVILDLPAAEKLPQSGFDAES